MANMADLMVRVGADTDELTSNVESAVSTVSEKLGKLGIGAAGAGAGLEGFARSQQDTNATIGRMSARTGEAEGSIRGMLDGMTNHTFATKDAAAGMELLSQRGVESKDQFAELLPLYDSYADATGQDMVKAMDDATRGMGAFGIPASESADHIDTLTYLSEGLDVEMDVMGRRLGRVSGEMGDLGLGLEDGAAGIKVFTDRGMDSRDAMNEFRDAVKDSDGNMDQLLDNLDVSAAEWASYQGDVSDASGMTDEFAEINNETMTPLQKMQGNLENLMTKYGGLADAAGMVAAPLTGVGTAMMGASMALPGLIGGVRRMATGIAAASTAIWGKITALGAWAGAMVAQGARAVASMVVTAAQFTARWAMMAATATINGIRIAAVWTAQIIASAARGAAAMAVAAARVVGGWVLMGAQAMLQAARMAAAWLIAMGPIGWIITAVVGLVALIIANWDKVKAWTITAWNAVVNFITNAWDNITSWISDAISNVGSFIQSGWEKVKSWTSAAWDAVLGFITGAWDSITSSISNAISNAGSFVQSGWNKVKSWTSSIWNGIVSWIAGIPGKILSGLASIGQLYIQVGQWILSVKDAAVDKFGQLISYVGGIPGKILSGLGDLGSLLYDGGANIIQGLIDGIGSMVGNIGDAIGGAVDTVKDFLPWSPAKKGPLRKNRPEDGGRNIVDMIAGGMADGESGVISEAERIAQAASVSAPDVPGPRVPGTGRVDAAGSGRDSQGSGNTTISIDMRGARMDSDKRVKQLSQELNTRIERTDRSRGRVSLEGATG